MAIADPKSYVTGSRARFPRRRRSQLYAPHMPHFCLYLASRISSFAFQYSYLYTYPSNISRKFCPRSTLKHLTRLYATHQVFYDPSSASVVRS